MPVAEDNHGLLTRDEFRESVFRRDHKRCVICDKPATAAHHILERRLFSDGGYYLDNGASLCDDCHLKAEQTIITCKEIRQKAGIKTKVVPKEWAFEFFGDEWEFDKWGNPYVELMDGVVTRDFGLLMPDEAAIKILKSAGTAVLAEFGCKSAAEFDEAIKNMRKP